MVEIATLDHPGLLAKIGGLFMMQGLDIHSAKIVNTWANVPKIFSLSPRKMATAMTPEESAEFAAALKTALDEASHQVCSQFTHIKTRLRYS